jgi:hypothetical protein
MDNSRSSRSILSFVWPVASLLVLVAGCGKIVQSSGGDAGECGDGGACQSLVDAAAMEVGPSGLACMQGQTVCSGSCVDTATSTLNCGGCGKSCEGGKQCSAGRCLPTCATGELLCNEACVDPQSDAKNCGQCGMACASSEDCISGACKPACKAGLRQPTPDDGKTTWDGLERAASTHAEAEDACSQIGGRLPTVSELFRASATQAADIGQTINTNHLWAGNPRGPGDYMIVRLSDANISNSTVATKRNYRCVCPASEPKTFSGDACYGPRGKACFSIDERRNMDIMDRPAQPLGSAVWECTLARAHVPDAKTYVEAILAQLPNGSFPEYVHTSDAGTNAHNIVLRWQKTEPVWANANNFGYDVYLAVRPFRCVGLKSWSTLDGRAIANEFVGPRSLLKSEKADSPALPWPMAKPACFARGGHLFGSAEAAELIMQGLPAGSGKTVWTSDSTGFSDSTPLTSIVNWTGVVRDYAYSGTGWAGRLEPMWGFRCVYYPNDPQIPAPQAADCSGGCFNVKAPASTASIWFDSTDRTAASWESAIATCRSKGGTLPTERDLVEAIRFGLPGSGVAIQTADLIVGNTKGVRPSTLKWTGADANFADLPPNVGWIGLTPAPFRCMWTNELR